MPLNTAYLTQRGTIKGTECPFLRFTLLFRIYIVIGHIRTANHTCSNVQIVDLLTQAEYMFKTHIIRKINISKEHCLASNEILVHIIFFTFQDLCKVFHKWLKYLHDVYLGWLQQYCARLKILRAENILLCPLLLQ